MSSARPSTLSTVGRTERRAGHPETERLFLAVTLPEEVRATLRERVRPVARRAASVRWVAGENIHVTLKFLGNAQPAQRDAVIGAMERVAARVPPFSVLIAGVKVVGRRKRPHMVWATVADSDNRLRRLHGRAERLLDQVGFAREERPFTPHITLARIRGGLASWEQELLEDWATSQQNATALPLPVKDVVLMKSELQPQGAQYTVCRRFELQGQ